MRSMEGKARSYYSEDVSMGSQKFLEMLLMDGCFILHSLKQSAEFPLDEIIIDLLRLENQIPFFVLDKLSRCVDPPQDIIQLALHSFGNLRTLGSRYLDIRPDIGQVRHLLHLFRLSLDPAEVMPIHPIVIPDTIGPSPRQVPSATLLQDQSALQFKKGTADSFLDIRFRNGLQLSDGLNTLFHNLIAFEQCYPEIDPCVTTFVAFMDCLINDESDVNLLERSGVLLNSLPNDGDAVFFFRKMSSRSEFRYSGYLNRVLGDLYKYRNSKWKIFWKRFWNRLYDVLRLNYFSNVWAFLSVVAAILLLIFSFIQAFYSVLSYYHM
uniref:UPF0481 protein At3g47200-like n=1 Tax=Elaeis guineensis var. tenera TaxID=51953 RepID=A0A8N4EQX5_ELAGV|nr:UPF0481 protein At3g47200-like [Elaeis guineensis]